MTYKQALFQVSLLTFAAHTRAQVSRGLDLKQPSTSLLTSGAEAASVTELAQPQDMLSPQTTNCSFVHLIAMNIDTFYITVGQ